MGTRRLPSRAWLGIAVIVLLAGLIAVATSSAQYGPYGPYPNYPTYNPPPSSGSPSSGNTSKKKKHSVTIKGSYGSYAFKPHKVTIKKGQSVTWSWNSDAPHNVTFGKKKHSKTAMKVKSYKLTFKKKGTFSYMCTVHGFTGKVVVK
ncbi:MAG: hypothetical protein E6G00_03965 [Actinobacteria bacterium]|nr:MAG: hypothetical protein E6G00_03965 [Actinomycetota bacterium]